MSIAKALVYKRNKDVFNVYVGAFMKIYTFSTPRNEKLFNDWFQATLKDSIPIIKKNGQDIDQEVVFMQDGWTKITLQKVSAILEAVNECWGSEFVFSDVDIQFFREILPVIKKIKKDCDLVFQQDSPDGRVCTGFFYCRANERTKQFWESVKVLMENGIGGKTVSDQASANFLLQGGKTGVELLFFKILKNLDAPLF